MSPGAAAGAAVGAVVGAILIAGAIWGAYIIGKRKRRALDEGQVVGSGGGPVVGEAGSGKEFAQVHYTPNHAVVQNVPQDPQSTGQELETNNPPVPEMSEGGTRQGHELEAHNPQVSEMPHSAGHQAGTGTGRG